VILDDDWDDDHEEMLRAWLRFVVRLDLPASALVSLWRVAFKTH
jgi:hypothetical protein